MSGLAPVQEVAGVVLTGGFTLPDSVRRLLEGVAPPLPIVRTHADTLPTALHPSAARREIHPPPATKIPLASGATASVQTKFVSTGNQTAVGIGFWGKFTTDTGTTSIDSVMVDPYRRG